MERSTLEYMRSDPNYHVCPSASCKYGHIQVVEEDGPIFTCEMCHKRACLACQAPMHSGKTCMQFQQRRSEGSEEARASARFVSNYAKIVRTAKLALERLEAATSSPVSRPIVLKKPQGLKH